MREVREREQAYCDRPCGLCLSKQGLGWVRLSVLNRRAQLQAALMLYPMLYPRLAAALFTHLIPQDLLPYHKHTCHVD
jgi:hypothetical protein